MEALRTQITEFQNTVHWNSDLAASLLYCKALKPYITVATRHMHQQP